MKHAGFLYLKFSFIIFLLLNSCQKTADSPIIARVGKATLTVADLSESIPPEYRDMITEEQNINYVKQWIDSELFYQEALRQKIDKEKEIKNRLLKMKKDLLSAELMNRTSLNTTSNTIENTSIHDYYEKNKDSFIREENLAKYIEILVSDSRTAWYITKNATTDNILTLAAEYSQNPVPENLNIPYVTIDNIPSDFKSTIQSTSPESASTPIKSDMGYHIIFLLDKLNKGEICKEEEVRNDIINHISNKAQKEKLDNLLSEIRLKTNVQFNPALIKNIIKKHSVPQP